MKEGGQPEADGIDPLLLKKVFPDAHEVFQFRPKSLDEIFPTAVFVLDTSTLLVPYGVGKTSLDEIEKLYRRLIDAKRMVVPAHVAREFARQRAEHIKDLFSALSKARNKSSASPITYPVLVQMDEYRELEAAETEVAASLAKRHAALGKLLDRIQAWRWDDPVSELYRRLFTKDVVLESDMDETATQKDARWRLDNRVPPGYVDARKRDNAAGDVLVWHTILTHARAHETGNVVLVSGDVKTDWFYRSENIPLYPRLELTDEYRRESKGGSFHIVTLGDLLRRLDAPLGVVQEVQAQEVLAQSRRPKHHWGFAVEAAVYRWLVKSGYTATRPQAAFPDFVARKDNKRFAVVVKLVSSKPLWRQKLVEATAQFEESQEGDGALIFFVAIQAQHAKAAEADFMTMGNFLTETLKRGRPIAIYVGFIGDDGELTMLAETP